MTGTIRRSGGLAGLVAAAAIGLAACGGSGSPQVASLGSGSAGTGNSATTGSSTAAKGDPAQLLNEWTACMRSHGDPNQAEPTVDASKGIHVVQPDGYYGTIYGPSGQSDSGAGVACQGYLTATSTALNGGQPVPQPDVATLDKHAACIRAHGVTNFPDPAVVGRGPATPASHSIPNPNSPLVQRASKLCAGNGMPALGGTLDPGDIEFSFADGTVAWVFF